MMRSEGSPGSSSGKKKVRDGDPRGIPVIRVAPGESEVSIDNGKRSDKNPHMCCVSDAKGASECSSNASTKSSSSTVRSNTAMVTPVGTVHPTRRLHSRKSYWRRRMEQFDTDSEVDAASLDNASHNRQGGGCSEGDSTASLSDETSLPPPPPMRARQSSILYQEGCIASLPLVIQVAFRRKMFSVFALQLLFISVLMVLLTYENVLSKLMARAFEGSAWYLLGTLAVMVFFLALLYLGHAAFPLNWIILLGFSVALSVFVSSVQAYLDTNAGLFCCGFTFLAVSLMIPLSGIECRVPPAFDSNGGTETRALLSSTRAGLIAFVVVLVGAGIVFAIFGDRFVSSSTAFGLAVVLEFALILWFSYDASTMYSIMSPDEYMSGVIFFYTDLLVVIVIIVVFGALALLFSSAGMGAGGFGGSCDCFGCMRVGRVFGPSDTGGSDDADATDGPTASSPVLPVTDSVGRRDSILSNATVVPEEMLR